MVLYLYDYGTLAILKIIGKEYWVGICHSENDFSLENCSVTPEADMYEIF